MSQADCLIREVKTDDDFVQIRNLIEETRRFNTQNPNFKLGPADAIKRWIFPEGPQDLPPKVKGFVLEEDGAIAGFMNVEFRGAEGGVLDYGIRPQSRAHIGALVDACSRAILDRGGNRLSLFAFTSFGQFRSPEVELFERFGFRYADQFMRVSARLELKNWEAAEGLTTDGVTAENDLSPEMIHSVLLADGATTDAIIFNFQYRTRFEPSTVILTLRNEQQEPMAYAFYKVKKATPARDIISATAFNVHFRPQFELSREQQRNFVQGALASMKQLDIKVAHTLMTLQNANKFTLLVREGFDDIQVCFFALTKRLEPQNVPV